MIHHLFRPAATFQVLEVGLQLPLDASALGKAILDFLPAADAADFFAEQLPRLTKRTATATALCAELKQVREQALATERDEAVLGESSVAAPIFDHVGNAVGAIGIVDATEVIFRAASSGG